MRPFTLTEPPAMSPPRLIDRLFAFVDQMRVEIDEADRIAARQRRDGQGEWLTGVVDGRRSQIEMLDRLLRSGGYPPEPSED